MRDRGIDFKTKGRHNGQETYDSVARVIISADCQNEEGSGAVNGRSSRKRSGVVFSWMQSVILR